MRMSRLSMATMVFAVAPIALITVEALAGSQFERRPTVPQHHAPSCADLRQQILDAPPNPRSTRVISVPAGYYYCAQGLDVTGKNRLRLRGAGRDKTILHFPYSVQNAIWIGSDVHDLEISGFALKGSMPLAAIPDEPGSQPQNYHRGIGTEIVSTSPDGTKTVEYSTNISSIRILDLEVFDFGTGIQIHPLCNEAQGTPDENGRNITIRNNLIHDVGPFVYGGGWGYGIHSACVKNLTIENNMVLRAARHAIYYGGGNRTIAEYQSRSSAGHVFINGNTVADSGSSAASNYGKSNIAIARTSFVTAAFNTILNPQSVAISVEQEDRAGKDPQGWHPQNVLLIGNQIKHVSALASAGTCDTFDAYRQVWLSVPAGGAASTDRVSLLGNSFNHSGRSLLVRESNSTSMDPGSDHCQEYYLATEPTSWLGTQAVVPASSGGLYIMQSNVLHHIAPTWKTLNPGNWTYTYSSTNWSGFQGMDVTRNYLFVLQSGVLHRLTQGNIDSYELHRYPDGTLYDWDGAQAIHATLDNLYIVQNNSLHRIPEVSWEHVGRPGDTPNFKFVTSLLGHLLVADSSSDNLRVLLGVR